MPAHGLIDTTEMYLRTVFELTEEGIVPLRASVKRVPQFASTAAGDASGLQFSDAAGNVGPSTLPRPNVA